MKKIIMTISAVVAAAATVSAQQSFTPDTLGTVQAAYQNPAELLRGELAGVRISNTGANPLAPVSVDVRGLSSLRTDNQPLWIVDGAMIENSSDLNLNPFWNYSEVGKVESINTFFQLSPYDIESIQVLKDASATALYGSRGAAGVIIINTRMNRKTEREVNFRTNFTAATGSNYYANMTGSKKNTAYNISLAFRNQGIKTQSLGANDFSFKSNFETREGKILWLGVNALASIGNVNNSGVNIADREDNAKRYAATASAWIRLNFTPFLNWTTTMGGDYRSSNRYIWYGEGNKIGASLHGLAGITSNSSLHYNVKSELTFNRFFAKTHKLEAVAGAEVYGNYSNWWSMAADDYFADELKAKGLNISNSIRPTFAYNDVYGHLAYYGRVAYAFKDIAGVNASFRADRTFNKFDGRYDMYPSGSAWFDIRNLAFKDCKAVSSLRIEGGYGITGNEKSLLYPFFDTMIDMTVEPEVEKARQNFLEGRSYQRMREWNAGGRIGFISDRIVLEGKYFRRNVEDNFDIFSFGKKDLEGVWQYSEKTLFNTRKSTFTSNGIEGAVSFVPVRTRNVEWTIRGNASYIVSQLTDVDDKDVFFDPMYNGSGFYASNLKGSAIGSIVGYKVGADGYYVDVVPDGKLTKADCVVLGNLIPTIQGGVGTSLRVYDFTLDIHGDFAAGFDVIDGKAMQADNRKVLTSRYVSRGDCFTLSRIALNYDIPVKSKVVKDLCVSLSGHNLATFTRFAGTNPEVALFGLNPLARGNDYYGNPTLPSIILGASIKF